jgi:CheY-like chemotaxis protein
MDRNSLYLLLKESVAALSGKDSYFKALPDVPDFDIPLNDFGLDIVTLPDVADDLKARLGGRNLGLEAILNPQDVNAMTIGQLLDRVLGALAPRRKESLVVYVDDEEENLFIFTRKFGKRFQLKTFTEPLKALEFIKSEENVALVITDEVMPLMSGNQLCDAVHAVKPFMKFVLITGNPNHDDDLMYRALRKNRFYDFINKPLDFERKGEEYFQLFNSLIHFEW